MASCRASVVPESQTRQPFWPFPAVGADLLRRRRTARGPAAFSGLARNLNNTGFDLACFNSTTEGASPAAVVGTRVALQQEPEGQGSLSARIVK